MLSRYVMEHQLLHTGEKPCVMFVAKVLHSVVPWIDICFVMLERNLANVISAIYTLHCLSILGYLSHQLLHIGEKPYKCDVCGKVFTQRGTLNRHLLIHTWEKPYKCGICGKHFTFLRYLRKLQLMHTGDKLISAMFAVNDLQSLVIWKFICWFILARNLMRVIFVIASLYKRIHEKEHFREIKLE